MTDLDEMELRSTLERREGVIRILERDLRESERKRRKLYDMLTKICKEGFCDRCWRHMLFPNCDTCNYHKTLEECK